MLARKHAIDYPSDAARKYLGLSDDTPAAAVVDLAIERGDEQLADACRRYA